MTIASQILKACQGAQAYTLIGGYSVNGSNRTTFEPCKWGKLRRNENGRCTYLDASYSDGSRLRFTHSDNHGSKLVELQK